MSFPVREAFNFSRPGAWGPVTSTLDFCEANYQFSHYVAEMANTVSNLVTVGLGLCGLYSTWDLPFRYTCGSLSIVAVGLGSMAFHAMLSHTAQLSDELPMVYAASIHLFILLDSERGANFKVRGNRKAQLLAYGLSLFDVVFTYTYWLYRNPVFHQVVFAIIMVSIISRGTWLLNYSEDSKRLNQETKKAIGNLYKWGAAVFILGFVIWNIDNVFCDALSGLKLFMNWPAAFLLEGHSWWHVFTAAGAYTMGNGTVYLTLCIKDDPAKYQVGYIMGCIPYVRQIPKSLKEKQ